MWYHKLSVLEDRRSDALGKTDNGGGMLLHMGAAAGRLFSPVPMVELSSYNISYALC